MISENRAKKAKANQDHGRYREIYQKALKLAIPMMIQGGIANAVILVDNLMAGSLGTESITGISISSQLLFVFNLAVFGGLSGPGIYGAQYYGRRDKDGFAQVFRLKIWIALIITLAGLIIFFYKGDFLIRLYLTSTEGNIDKQATLQYGLDYLNIMLAGLVPFSLVQVYAQSFREMNKSLPPMAAGIISVIVDVVFNYLLIYGKLGFPQMGVKGAALATVLARIVELLSILAVKRFTDKFVFMKGIYRSFSVSASIVKTIIPKGLPIFINEFLWSAGLAALIQCYSRRGLAVVAGLNISNVLCNLFNVVFVNLGAAVGIIEGQFLGASDFERAKDSAEKLTWFCGGICIILAIILIGLSPFFPRAYNTSSEVRQLAAWFIVITAVFFPVQGILNAQYFIIRSGGKTIITFVFDSVFSWFVSVPLAYILCCYSSLPILMIVTLIQTADLFKVFIGFILLKKGVWITNLVAK